MTKTITLAYPIQAHGEQVTELTFKRLTMRDLIEMDKVQGEMGKVAKIIERSANIPASSVAQIDAADIAGISEVIADFLPSSLQTGKSVQSD